MPVKIPELQRISPQLPVSAGRSQLDVRQTGAQAVTGLSQALVGLGAEGIKSVERIEKFEADTEATNRATEYELARRELISGPDGIKFKEGNPTALYKTAQEAGDEVFKRLSNFEDSNISERTQREVVKNLNRVRSKLDLQDTSEYGAQLSKYEDRTKAASTQLEQNRLSTTASYVEPNKPETIEEYDKSVRKIIDLNIQRGLKLGTVVPDEKGRFSYVDQDGETVKVSMDQSSQLELTKDLSDGVYNSINNLVKSGSLQAAELLNKTYGPLIDPVNAAKLTKAFEEESVERQALTAVGKAEGKTATEQKAIFNKLEPEAKQLAFKQLDDLQRRKVNIEKRSSTRNYNDMSDYIQGKMNSSDPFNGTADLQRDIVYKLRIDRITDPKQKKALIDMVLQPKDSSQESVNNMQNLFFGEDPNFVSIKDVSPEQFNMFLSGLSKADRSFWSKKYQLFQTETGAEQNARYKSAGRELTDQLLATKYIKRNRFGKLSPKDEIKMIDARNQFTDWLDANVNRPMTPKEIKDFTRDFAISKKKDEIFNPVVRPRFQGGSTRKRVPVDLSNAPGSMVVNGKSLLQWGKDFRKINGRWPDPKTDEFKNFIKKGE